MTHATPLLRRFAVLAALGLAATTASAGTTTFAVVNNGFGAWTIDGQDNRPLTLVRGETYVFDLTNVSAVHPFNINTINITGNGNRYNVGVTNNGASGNTDITFVVPAAAPDSLHYNCANHGAMNGSITIIDAVVDAIFADGFDPAVPRPAR